MQTILAVDDSRSMRALVKETLSEAGYDVVQACDGVEALGIAQDRSFNLVLADINMPNMDGLTLLGKLRALDGFRFTPILMLTTEMSSDKKKEAKQIGATGWITKPFDPDKLLATIKKVI